MCCHSLPTTGTINNSQQLTILYNQRTAQSLSHIANHSIINMSDDKITTSNSSPSNNSRMFKLLLLYWQRTGLDSPCRKSWRKMQNLRENCAENELKSRAICASCMKIEQKIARKLRVNVLWISEYFGTSKKTVKLPKKRLAASVTYFTHSSWRNYPPCFGCFM